MSRSKLPRQTLVLNVSIVNIHKILFKSTFFLKFDCCASDQNNILGR